MSILQAVGSRLNVTSVSFVPLRKERKAVSRPVVELSALPLLNRILGKFGPALKDLARRTRRLGPIDGGALVLVTGCQRGAGCSTLALALATAAAGERPAVLVDADLAHAGLSEQLGDHPRTGWEDRLPEFDTAAGTLRPVDRRGTLAFFPLQEPVADAKNLLAQPNLPRWLGQLRRCYDLVVVDGGPVLQNGACWAGLADVAILVCDSRKQPGYDWAHAWDRLEEGGTHVLGIVETFVPVIQTP